MDKQEIIDFSESLKNAQASLSEAQRIIDFGLDLMNALNNQEQHKKFRNFDLRLSLNPFSHLIEEGSNTIDVVYWNDSVNELKFDIDALIRNFDE